MKVYLVTYKNGEEYVSSTLYEKEETATKVAEKYNEEYNDDGLKAIVTSLNVIEG